MSSDRIFNAMFLVSKWYYGLDDIFLLASKMCSKRFRHFAFLGKGKAQAGTTFDHKHSFGPSSLESHPGPWDLS